MQLGDVRRTDAAVDLDVHVLRQQLSQPRHALERRFLERLPGVARMDAHAEHQIRVGGDGRDVLGRCLRVECDSGLQPGLAGGSDRRGHVVHRLDVERDAVPARLRNRLEVLRGALDHQMHIHRAAPLVHARRDRLQHDRPHRDRFDEVPVADVEMEDATAGVEQRVDLVAEVREVRPVQRRLDFGAPHPLCPAHVGIVRRRAMKNPLVRSRSGRVSRNSGRVGCAYCGHSAVSGSTSSPEASTTASFSSAFSVHTE